MEAILYHLASIYPWFITKPQFSYAFYSKIVPDISCKNGLKQQPIQILGI